MRRTDYNHARLPVPHTFLSEETMAQIPVLPARGANIPALGFGTSQLGDCGEIVATALRLGYRHIDTAWKYGSEKGVGEGIRASGVPRNEIFLCTKVSHEYLRADDFARSVDESLLCPEPLVTLQAEYHPYLDQSKVLAYCRKVGLIFTAYCPLARGRLFNDPMLGDIAKRKGRTIAQVALRWLMQQGNIAAIPRSSNPKHIAESLDIFDFELTPSEMQEIFALKRPAGRIANPKGRAPVWD
ncbi:MAG: 2,5-diketo-D-gluconate reductase [Burkholderiales bacterium]|nr:2,5-diketo-D-gluconate reductase [Burkholderiales bacterium]